MSTDINWSGSAVERVIHCPPSAVMPQARRITYDGTRGHALHGYVEALSLGEHVEQAIARVPERFRREARALDWSRTGLVLTDFMAEVAFAYNVLTGEARELGRRIDRDYDGAGREPGELPLTLDLVGVTEDAAIILDWKFGHDGATEPGRNPQLLTGALAACRAYGRKKAVVGLLLAPDGEAYMQWAEVDEAALEAHADMLRDTKRRAELARGGLEFGDVPEVTEGEHCKYCPAFAHCPAKRSLALALASGGIEQGLGDLPLTTESAGRAWEVIEKAEAMLERVKESLAAFGEANPFPLSDGRVVGPVETFRDRIDTQKAAIALAAHYGTGVATAAIKSEPTLTKSRLKPALVEHARAQGDTRSPSDLEKEALDLLEREGALVELVEVKVKPHKPPKEPKPKKAPAAKKARGTEDAQLAPAAPPPDPWADASCNLCLGAVTPETGSRLQDGAFVHVPKCPPEALAPAAPF